MSEINFPTEKSFFEHLGVASLEKVHSQFIAWLFSESCQAISNEQRIGLLIKVFKLTGIKTIKRTGTEIKRADIVITTDTTVLIIENKLKSSEHSNQLDKYKKAFEPEFPNLQKKYFYLSLINEGVSNSDWQQIMYKDFYTFLKEVKLNSGHKHSVIVQEYILYFERLIASIRDFTANVQLYESIFTDGNKTIHEKMNNNHQHEIVKFIAENQMETFFQKIYLYTLRNDLGKPVANVTETQGVGLIDIYLDSNIEFGKKKFHTFIQLQGNTIKFSFQIQDNYIKSSDKLVLPIIPLMEELSKSNKFGYNKLNKPKSHAYVSISKQMNPPYWKMPKAELIKFMQTELEHGKILSKTLLGMMK